MDLWGNYVPGGRYRDFFFFSRQATGLTKRGVKISGSWGGMSRGLGGDGENFGKRVLRKGKGGRKRKKRGPNGGVAVADGGAT